MASTHIIGKIKLQVDVEDNKTADDVFQLVQDLNHNALADLFEKILDAVDPNKQLKWNIDRLVIDLGSLDRNHLSEALLAGIRKTLEERLNALLSDIQPDLMAVELAQRNLLLYFLKHGRYPWWADENSTRQPLQEMLKAYLRDDPDGARKTLSEALSDPDALRRLVLQLSKDNLLQLLRTIHPGWAFDLEDFTTFLNQVQPSAGGNLLVTLAWEAAIQWALQHGTSGDRPSEAAFFSAALSHIAHHIRVPIHLLHQHLLLTSAEGKRPAPSALAQYLENTVAASGEERTDKQAAIKLLKAGGKDSIAHLLFFLEKGRMPRRVTTTIPELEAELLRLARAQPDRIQTILKTALQNPEALRRFVLQFSKTGLHQLVSILQPALPPGWMSGPEPLFAFLKPLQSGPHRDQIATWTWEAAILWALHANETTLAPTEAGFIRAVLSTIAKQLNVSVEILHDRLQRSLTQNGATPHPAWAQYLEQGTSSQADPGNALTIRDAWALLLYFLEHGQLLRLHQHISPDRLLKMLVQAAPERSLPAGSLAIFKKPSVRARLSRQFSGARQDDLLGLLTGASFKAFMEAGSRLLRLISGGGAVSNEKVLLRNLFLDFITQSGSDAGKSGSDWLQYVFVREVRRRELPDADFSEFLARMGQRADLSLHERNIRKFLETGTTLVLAEAPDDTAPPPSAKPETLETTRDALAIDSAATEQNEDGKLTTDHILYFLEKGRLPDKISARAEDLEAGLLRYIREQPENARRQLLVLSRTINLPDRLSRQFPDTIARAVLELLYPMQWPEIRELLEEIISLAPKKYERVLSVKLVWQTALKKLLAYPDTPADLQGLLQYSIEQYADQLKVAANELRNELLHQLKQADHPEERPLFRMLALETPVAEPDVQPPAGRPAPEAQLLYFLEWGRLPEGGSLDPEQLEAILLQRLAETPGWLRQQLLYLQHQPRLAARLSTQFSSTALRAVVENLLPDDQKQDFLSLLRQLVTAIHSRFSDRLSEDLFWQAALQYLIPHARKQIDLPAMIHSILVQLSAKLALRADEQDEAGLSGPDALARLLIRELKASGREAERKKRQSPDRQPSAASTTVLLDILKALPPDVPPALPALRIDPDVPEALEEPDQVPVLEGDTPEAAQLLYFLNRGRLPDGATIAVGDIGKVLLKMIASAPDNTRQQLLEINRNVNLAARLEQRLSTAALQKLLSILFPRQWPQLQTILTDLTTAASRLYPTQLRDTFIWRTAFRRLLAQPAADADLPQLLIDVIQEMAGYMNSAAALVLEQQLLPELLQTEHYHILSRQTILRATGNLTGEAHERLSKKEKRWQKENAGQTAESSQALSAVDRLLVRIGQEARVWWDSPGTTTDQLLHELTALDAAALRVALSRIWGIREKWLPELRQETFDAFLSTFWGDYAALFLSIQEGLRWIAKEQNLSLRWAVFQERILRQAMSSGKLHSGLLVKTALQATAASSAYPEKEWETWLLRYADMASEQGDPYARRMREVLPETPGLKIPEPPEVHVPEAHPAEPLNYAAILEQELQAVWTYLQQGTLPPESSGIGRQALGQTILRLLRRHPELLLPLLRSAFGRREGVKRLMDTTTPQTWALISSNILTPFFEETMELRIAVFSRLDRLVGQWGRLETERFFFEYALNYAGSGSGAPYNPVDFTAGLLRWLIREKQIPEALLWEYLSTAHPGSSTHSDKLEAILPALRTRYRRPATPQDASENPSPEAAQTNESMYIHNAGLVLLAPYLPRYFETLGLLENRMFRDDLSRERAVHLLQYLVTGQSATPEHLLVFNKVLCGIPLDAPVPLGIELSEEEESVARSLLSAVLQHWEIMRNASIENFQGSFLVREGKLDQLEDRWTLKVEGKSYDIVLQYIPWTFSIVSLPWMEKRIDVEWIKKS